MTDDPVEGSGSSDSLPGVPGGIDTPDGAVPVARGPMIVQGWAYDAERGVSRVDLWLDRQYLGRAALLRWRSDVATALGRQTRSSPASSSTLTWLTSPSAMAPCFAPW